MTSNKMTNNVCEVVGVLNSEESLDSVIDHLLTSGFDQSEISLLATEKSVVEKLGHRYQKISSLEAEPTVPRKAYVAPENMSIAQGALVSGFLYVGAFAAASAVLALGGTIAMILAGGTLGATGGGLIGAVLGEFMEEKHAAYIQEQLEHGGLLIWVRARDQCHESEATRIMRLHKADDVRSIWCSIPT